MRLFFLLPVILFCAAFVPEEAVAIDISATGEHRISGSESPELARQMSWIAARENVLGEVRSHLQNSAPIKALSLRARELDALLPVIVNLTEESPDAVEDSGVYRTRLLARVEAASVARRIGKLRKDPQTVAALIDAQSQTESLLKQLTAAGSRSAAERESLVNRIRAQRLAALALASLAKVEEGPASARIASAKERQRAKQLAELAVMIGAAFPETHLAMGDSLMSSFEHIDVAEAEYREALRLDPTSTPAHIRHAEAQRLGGKVTEAIAELRETLVRAPDSAEAHTDLGFILGTQQNAEVAIAEYREAIRIAPDYIEAHNNLAIALARQQKLPEAVAEFREIVRLDPDSALGYYNMGVALADLDMDAESAEALRHVARINPNHFNARYNLGELLRLEGKFDEAVTQFKTYLRLAPDTPQNQRNVSRAREFVETHENK
jgi:tetratricopeptide (TPR) repeat protein